MHIDTTIKTAFEKHGIDVNEREGHHIIPIVVNKTRSCACKLKYLLLWLVNLEFFFFFFFYFSKKMGRSGDGKRNILLGWSNLISNEFVFLPILISFWCAITGFQGFIPLIHGFTYFTVHPS